MHLAITDPNEFCGLVQAALPRPTSGAPGSTPSARGEDAGAKSMKSRAIVREFSSCQDK